MLSLSVKWSCPVCSLSPKTVIPLPPWRSHQFGRPSEWFFRWRRQREGNLLENAPLPFTSSRFLLLFLYNGSLQSCLCLLFFPLFPFSYITSLPPFLPALSSFPTSQALKPSFPPAKNVVKKTPLFHFSLWTSTTQFLSAINLSTQFEARSYLK